MRKTNRQLELRLEQLESRLDDRVMYLPVMRARWELTLEQCNGDPERAVRELNTRRVIVITPWSEVSEDILKANPDYDPDGVLRAIIRAGTRPEDRPQEDGGELVNGT